ncbi:hypothetical protein SETIT_2G056000v2 [Setaria italica]|uniref:Uncharacterized protein n=1 Tax=Setaria italica TaxID=4555 RepID=A0A368PVW1_SETIT|nr:hypothetical protein SETIT_2G056000v2 [Setaria italica]
MSSTLISMCHSVITGDASATLAMSSRRALERKNQEAWKERVLRVYVGTPSTNMPKDDMTNAMGNRKRKKRARCSSIAEVRATMFEGHHV